ncbi:MAG: YdcF family protein [Clostridia bacterium]|nr:YdcF family protein [Clostridia bacterium]
MKKTLKILSIILAVVIGYFVVTASIYLPFVIHDAKTDYIYEYDFDYLMILGNQVVGKDTPSSLMIERIDRAVEYLSENKECVAVVCGGITTDEQIISEAELMKKLLIEKGIGADRIILEDKSTTTFENFEYARKVIENHSGKSIKKVLVAFLSSDYHIHRASVIAEHYGYNNIGKVSCTTQNGFVKTVIREYFVGYDLLIRLIKD